MSHGVNKSFENVDRYYEMGANIAYYRRLAGFTQAQLAERVGGHACACKRYRIAKYRYRLFY